MHETIGQQLQTARKNKNFSVEEIAEELHIREVYLRAMEENQIEQMLPAVQAKGFLHLYADFLGIVLLKELEKEVGEQETPDNLDSGNEAQSEKSDTNEDQTATVERTGFGIQFTNARNAKELSFSDIETELHISRSYLQAIEEEDFPALPQGIQARGMIQRYAVFLEMEVEPVLDQYADILYQSQPALISDQAKRKQARKVDGAKQIITPDLIIGLALLAIIFSIAFFGVRRVISTRDQISTPDATAEISLTSPTITPSFQLTATVEELQGTALPAEIATATLQVRPTTSGNENQTSRVIVQIITNQRAYLQIIADEETVFDGRVVGGNIYEFYAQQRIDLLTGNAAALDITVIQDGRETNLGILGLVGQVINLTFQPDVIITPTVTPSLTPTTTNTPLPSATPTITSSPTPNEEQ